MQPKQMDFTAEVELKPMVVSPSNGPTDSNLDSSWCYGVVLWFETGFTERFCRDKPVVLSTSPYGPSTHWSQTVLTFREPIALAKSCAGKEVAPIGTNDSPAAKIHCRISIVRATQHRSIDISLELTAISSDGRRRSWPPQIFNLN